METEQKLRYFDPHSHGRQRCVFLVLQGCSTGGPEAHSGGWSATSYQQLLCTPTQSGAPSPFGLVWLSLPHLVYNSVRSLTATHQGPQGPFGLMWLYLPHLVHLLLQLKLWLLSWLSPTWSLEWHDWLSSSGNNCHTVHRSLSSGASVYECTMGIFYLVPFHQPISVHAISSHNCHQNVSPPSERNRSVCGWQYILIICISKLGYHTHRVMGAWWLSFSHLCNHQTKSVRTLSNLRCICSIIWSSCGVREIVFGNGNGSSCSNPGQDYLYFIEHSYPRDMYASNYSLSCSRQIVG